MQRTSNSRNPAGYQIPEHEEKRHLGYVDVNAMKYSGSVVSHQFGRHADKRPTDSLMVASGIGFLSKRFGKKAR